MVTAAALSGILVQLFAGACTTSPKPKDPAALLRAPFSDQTTKAAIDALATAGVQVVEDYGDTQPVDDIVDSKSPLRFTRWQAENMARESSVFNGYLGRDLDGLIPRSQRAIPLSYIMGAWIMRGQSDAARFSQRLMGRRDWRLAPSVIYPTIVIALFIGDLTRQANVSDAAATRRAATSGSFGFAMPALAIGRSALDGPFELAGPDPCASILGGVNSMLDQIFNAIKFNESQESPLLSLAAKLANVGLFLAHGTVSVLIGNAVKSLASVLGPAITVLSALSLASSMLHNWALTVSADPAATEYSVDQTSKIFFDFTASVDAGTPWPSALVGCVKTVSGVDLNTIGPKGSVVGWNVMRGGLAFQSLEQTQLDSQNSAIDRFYTNSESQKEHDKGKPVTKHVVAYVTVQRGDYKRMKDILAAVIINQLPAAIPGFIKDILKANLVAVLAKFNVVPVPKGAGSEAVTFHVLSSPSPSPSARPSLLPLCSYVTRAELNAAFPRPMVTEYLLGGWCEFASFNFLQDDHYTGPYDGGYIGVSYLSALPAVLRFPFSDCAGIPGARCSRSLPHVLFVIKDGLLVRVSAAHYTAFNVPGTVITELPETEDAIARYVTARIP